MIRKLKKRATADRYLNDVRAEKKKEKKLGRNVYLVLIGVLFLYLTSLFAEPYLRLNAAGMIVSDQIAIASPHEVQVEEVYVTPGHPVRKGDALAKVHSPRVLETVATLTAGAAETAAKESDLAAKVSVARALLKAATERAEDADKQWKDISEGPKARGFVSDAFLANVQNNRYVAMEEKASREAELRAATEQLAVLHRTQEEARKALENLRKSYGDGVIGAPEDGLVGAKVAVRGTVAKAGEPLMELHVGNRYALVYLHTGTLFQVQVGDRVTVTDHFATGHGRMADLLPVTLPLPPEFQKAYKPPSRGRVAMVELDDPTIFPMSSTVYVKGDGILTGTRAYRTARAAIAQYLHPTAIAQTLSKGWTKISGQVSRETGGAVPQ